MAQYRAYLVDANNRITEAVALDCDDDGEAVGMTVGLCELGTVELWQGKRLVQRIDRQAIRSRPTHEREAGSQATHGIARGKVVRILIADDDRPIRNMLANLFREEGFEVAEAVDGDDCINGFQRKPADLILCDIFMPNKGGIFVVETMRRIAPQVPIVIMTGADLTRTQIESVLGAVPVIEKPFRPRKLLAIVRECLAQADPGRG